MIVDIICDSQDNSALVYGKDIESFLQERAWPFTMISGGYEVIVEDIEDAEILKQDVADQFSIDVEIREETK